MQATIGDRLIQKFMGTLRGSSFSALLLDYDGTLAPFSIDRESAVPYPGVRSVLQDISDTTRTRLVIITGRRAADVEPLLGLNPPPEVWGSHGLQRLRSNGQNQALRLDQDTESGLANAERWLAYQGLHHLAEPKPGGLAVHWRGLDAAAAATVRGKIILGWSALARSHALTILEFDGGIELRCADGDKGSAVRTILGEIGPDTLVAYLGDDPTDEPAFRALNDRGLTVLVRQQERSTAAQVWLRPPEELIEFLVQWRDTCRTPTFAMRSTNHR